MLSSALDSSLAVDMLTSRHLLRFLIMGTREDTADVRAQDLPNVNLEQDSNLVQS